MKMVIMQDEESLIKRLSDDVRDCGKDTVIVQAGHFPLFYAEDGCFEEMETWKPFPLYSMEIGCRVAKIAKGYGKRVLFTILSDDKFYVPRTGLSTSKQKSRRHEFYRFKSGADAKVQSDLREVMIAHGFSEADVIRSDHGKEGRHDCLYFSELLLRASGPDIDNACAKAYVALYLDNRYFNRDEMYLVSFVPNRCERNICQFAIPNLNGVLASHVFLPSFIGDDHMMQMFKANMVKYRKDQLTGREL
jgi:hypothetical protein